MQPNKAPSEAAAAAAALQQRANGEAAASISARDGSDGSDDWEDVCTTFSGARLFLHCAVSIQ